MRMNIRGESQHAESVDPERISGGSGANVGNVCTEGEDDHAYGGGVSDPTMQGVLHWRGS